VAPTTGNALLILVAFVLPGFVALLIGERTHLVPVRNRQAFELLLIATYYSVVCWGIMALASWPFGLGRADLRRMWREESLGELAGLGLLAILVVPGIVATLVRFWKSSRKWRPRALGWLGIHEAHSIPTAWDELFRRRRPAMVRAVLIDKRVVGGYYGSESFPGYGEESQDLLLEERWTLDGDHWFAEPAPGSHGLWLSAGSIVSLELYDPVYERPTEEAGSAAAVEEAGRPPATEAGDEAGRPAPEAGGG
jgi:hypothetical protein